MFSFNCFDVISRECSNFFNLSSISAFVLLIAESENIQVRNGFSLFTQACIKRYWNKYNQNKTLTFQWVFRGSDRMVVGFTTTCAITAYHH